MRVSIGVGKTSHVMLRKYCSRVAGYASKCIPRLHNLMSPKEYTEFEIGETDGARWIR